MLNGTFNKLNCWKMECDSYRWERGYAQDDLWKSSIVYNSCYFRYHFHIVGVPNTFYKADQQIVTVYWGKYITYLLHTRTGACSYKKDI